MRKLSRRFFSMLLAASMVFGLSGMTALAAETDRDAPATIAADADSCNVKYAVCLWGINEDTDPNGHTLGLTFGPATGADYTDTYNAHLTKDAYDAGGICLHWMSWEEIAEQSRIDPTVFEACLENGCTHSVDITLNDTILSASYAGQAADGDGAGMLSESIGENYRYWNSSNNVSDGYPASQVRAVLNGKDDLTGGYARYALTEENCLFSCFPEDLRDAIVAKAVKSDTLYTSQSEGNSKTTYDKLWLFSGKEIYAASGTTADPVIRSTEGDLYQRSELLGITTNDYAALKNYDEDGKTRNWWTRSMTQANNTQVYLVMTGGVPNYYDTTNTSVGLAPGFCLAGPIDKTELETAITEVEETMRGLDKDDYTAASWEALEEALADAKAMMEVPDVTQAQVDAARTTLLNALEDLEPVTEQAFAVYSAEDDSLSFYTGFAPTEGDTYQDKTATTVYTDVDSIAASDADDIPWYDLRESVTSVVIDSTFSEAQPISLAYWFDEFENAAFDGLEYVDTSDVTDMQHTFRNCSGLTTLDLSGWDTTSVTANTNFATGCSALQWVKIGDKTTIFTLGQCVTQQNWYDSSTNGKLVSSNYLRDVKEAGQYWTFTENTGSGVTNIEKINGVWTYTVDGKPDYTYTGFGSNNNGKWYVEKGIVTFAKQDILKDTTGGIGTKGDWYYVIGSEVQTGYTGVSDFRNANGWWYISGGKVDFSANTVAKNANGWWYVTDGKVQFGYSGVANYKNANGWWYISGGKVDFSANTVAKNANGWWYVIGGKVQFDFTGLANYKNANGWWYIKSGKVDFSFVGIASNRHGTWYIKDGKVDFSFTGTVVTASGKRYTVTKGKAS